MSESSRLHFVARAGRSAELVELLRGKGFTNVKLLPRERVLLEAPPDRIRERLGIAPEDGGGAGLAGELGELVDRVYRPKPPERLARDQ